ncbi:hypothetical protein C8R46DRAFT_86413 [Mycena filopes]|nr:hypothetical protein C8R46DRAFT_86413 [Mycena filopes]
MEQTLAFCVGNHRLRKRKNVVQSDSTFSDDSDSQDSDVSNFSDDLSGESDSISSTLTNSRALRPLPRRGRSRRMLDERDDDCDGDASQQPRRSRRLNLKETDLGHAVEISPSPSTSTPRSKRRRLNDPCESSTLAQNSRHLAKSSPPSKVPLDDQSRCANCNIPWNRLRRGKSSGDKLCASCYGYERTHGRSRPMSLFLLAQERAHSKVRALSLRQRAEARLDPSLSIQCANCKSSSSRWALSKLLGGVNICQTCHRYERIHSVCRPPSLVDALQKLCYAQKAPDSAVATDAHSARLEKAPDSAVATSAHSARLEKASDSTVAQQCGNCRTLTKEGWGSEILVDTYM